MSFILIIFYVTEKDELINLVMIYASNPSISGTPEHTTGPHQQPQDPNDTNCTNPFEQIRQTCTNIFTNITERIATDLQKNPTFASAFTAATGSSSPSTPMPPPPPSQQQQRQPDIAFASSYSYATNPSNPPSGSRERRSSNSGPTTERTSNGIPRPVTSTDTSSSFEEIGAVGGQSPEDWQFVTVVTNPPRVRSPEEELQDEEKKQKLHKIKHSIDKIDRLLGEKRHQTKKINRRRSDSDVSNISEDIRNCLFNEEVKRSRKSCEKCNDASEKIRRRISEFRQQLELPNVNEGQNQVLDEFLTYLESSSKQSVPHTPEERERCDGIRLATETISQPHAHDVPSTSSSSQQVPVQDSPDSPLERIPFDPNQRVDLDDINSNDDFDLLTVKQMKEILALNRVDFKGCCEKNELKERVMRLWKNHVALPKPDDLPPDDLCKICMDAPIECVILECGHLVACVRCSKVLSECPICRAYVVRVVRFFRV